uniref:Uncharacterized protein n=1 Tax=Oreochromis niloticus TaxID=8128 RepID=A0A669F7X5_ORENI
MTKPKIIWKCTCHHPSTKSCFSAAGTRKLVRVKGKMHTPRYRGILDDNLLQCALDWGEGSSSNRITFLSTQSTQQRSRSENVCALMLPIQPDGA